MEPKILQVYSQIQQGVAPLKAIREALGLTQQEFAEKLGVVVSTVHRWETGKSEMTLDLEQIQKFDKMLQEIGLTFHTIPTKAGPPPKSD